LGVSLRLEVVRFDSDDVARVFNHALGREHAHGEVFVMAGRSHQQSQIPGGTGVKQSSSHLLIDNCDEFIFYDDLARSPKPTSVGRGMESMPKEKREAFTQLLAAVAALLREGRNAHSSLVKDTMKRKQPQFNEEYHGYSSFSRLLEDAERNGLIKLRRDPRSGTYVVVETTEG
jgi:hypothetical protein